MSEEQTIGKPFANVIYVLIEYVDRAIGPTIHQMFWSGAEFEHDRISFSWRSKILWIAPWGDFTKSATLPRYGMTVSFVAPNGREMRVTGFETRLDAERDLYERYPDVVRGYYSVWNRTCPFDAVDPTGP